MEENDNLSLIHCPVCSEQISSSAASCPHCGHPLKKAEEPKKKSLAKRIITVLIIIFVVIPLLIYAVYSAYIAGVGTYIEKGKSGLHTVVCELPEECDFREGMLI